MAMPCKTQTIMRKLYLLITAALLLIGSGTLWAASYTYNYKSYETEDALWEAVGTASSATITVGAESDLTIPAGKIVTLKENVNEQTNGTFTNYGTLKTSAYPVRTWNSGTFVNNGTLTLQTATWDGVVFENSGTLTIAGGTFKDATFTNNGTFEITGGIIKTEILDNVINNCGAKIKDGYESNTFYDVKNYPGYKQILATTNIAAKITKDGTTYAFGSLTTAMDSSSIDNPAVLQKNIESTTGTTSTTNITVSDGKDKYIDLNGKTITISSNLNIISNGSLTITGTGYIETKKNVATAFWLKGSSTPTNKPKASLTIGENVIINCTNDGSSAICIDKNGSASYGVVVNVNGKINTTNTYALYINGNVNKTVGNVPVINIGDNAVITGGCGDDAAIYAAGYGIWNIGAASLKAATPIYAKAGQININGATIEACGEYAEPVANNNGFNPTGDAILIDSHESYAGDVILSIQGETTITSANGYAIQEALTKMDNTKAIGLTIVGGSFAGAKGSVKLSDEFAKALADGSAAEGKWTLNAVTGGKYTSRPTAVADGYEVVEVSGAFPFLYGVVEKTATSYTTNYFEDKAEYLNFTVARGNEYVVRTGHTVNIGTLTIGDDASYPARVRVQPKGTLVVGDVVINNSKGAESLIVESDVTGYGVLLFNSNTVTNPLGTVEMYSHARVLNAENNQYLFQHFGLPVYSGEAYITKNVPASYSAWDIKKGWGYVSSDVVLNNGPWTGSNEVPNNTYAGSMFSFSGALVGNSDAEYNISSSEYGYKCFANSYSAPMSMTEFMEQYNNPDVTDGTVWVFKASDYEKRGKEFVQWVYADAADENAAIDPLQAFFVLHQSSTDDSFTVNYKDAVYDFNKGLNGNVKSADAVTVDNKGKITITDGNSTATLNLYESQDLSDDFDMNYDGYQMETGNIQIYISLGGKKWSSFGSNSFDGKEITIVSKEASQITMSFSKLGGKAFKLTDMASGAEVEVGSDKTYTFTVEPNTTAVRFKLGEGEVSANEADANEAVNIWSNNGRIFVANNVAEADIEIINLSGVKVASAKASGEAVQDVSISNLASGVYVVRVGNTAAKIVK